MSFTVPGMAAKIAMNKISNKINEHNTSSGNMDHSKKGNFMSKFFGFFIIIILFISIYFVYNWYNKTFNKKKKKKKK